MVSFVGKYKFERSENLDEYLMKLGGPKEADAAKFFEKSAPTIECAFDGKEYTVTITNEGKSIVNKFFENKPFNEMMPHGHSFETIATKDGNKMTFVSDLKNGNSSIRVYEFTEDEVIVHLSDKVHGVKATRWYKRM